jgi:hypothetical protein
MDMMTKRKPPQLSTAARLKAGVAVLLTAVFALTAVPATAQADTYVPDVTATISYSSDTVTVGDMVTMTATVDKTFVGWAPSEWLNLFVSYPDYLTPRSVDMLSGCGGMLSASNSPVYIQIQGFEADGPSSCVYTVTFEAMSPGTSAAPTTSGNVEVTTKPAAGITSLPSSLGDPVATPTTDTTATVTWATSESRGFPAAAAYKVYVNGVSYDALPGQTNFQISGLLPGSLNNTVHVEALSNTQDVIVSSNEVTFATGDRSPLQLKVSQAKAFVNGLGTGSSDYTEPSLAALTSAIASGDALATTMGTAQQYTAAIDLIDSAQSGLVNISGLRDSVEAAEPVDQQQFTSGTYATLAAALETAKALLANPDAAQDAVNLADQNLSSALGALTPIPASLAQLMSESAAVVAADYTSSSYAAFKSVYDPTRAAIENDPNPDAGSIVALESPLRSVFDSLVSVTSLVGPERDLIAAISVYPYTFTGPSYIELSRVLNKLTTARVAGTDAEIAAVVVEAQAAIDGQVSTLPLTEALAKLDALVEDQYTAYSWAGVQSIRSEIALQLTNTQNYAYTDAEIEEIADYAANLDNFVVKVQPLVDAIDRAATVSTDGMAPGSIAHFNAALAALVQLQADSADVNTYVSDVDITNAVAELDVAIGGLHSLAPLLEAQASMDALVEDDYTAASWNNIVLMRETFASTLVSSADGFPLPNDYIIDQANEAHRMIDALVSIRPLIDAIASADSVSTDGVSAFSVYELHSELAHLIWLRDAGTGQWVTDEDIAEAVASFNDQVNNGMLSLTPMVAAVAAAEDTMAGLSADGYTDYSWNAARAAIAHAKGDLNLWSTDQLMPAWQSGIDWDLDQIASALNDLVHTSLTVEHGDERVTSGSTIPAGSQLHFEAEGLQPATEFRVELHSTPTVLGSVLVDADGKASLWVSVPADFVAGSHTLHVFSTQLWAFTPTDTVLPVTVTAAPGTPAATTPAAATAGTPTGDLASTGGTVDGFVFGGGLLLLLLGGALRLAARRSRARA